MTREEFLEKVDEIIPDIAVFIRKKALSLLDSGAVDLESYENNYVLPKLFICAVGEEISDQYRLPNETRKNIKTIRNMYRMM